MDSVLDTLAVSILSKGLNFTQKMYPKCNLHEAINSVDQAINITKMTQWKKYIRD